MFKAIKFIADLVRQNNECQSALGDIALKLQRSHNELLTSNIDVDYIICEIDKLQKENANLKKELDLMRDEGTALVEKYSNTPNLNYKETKPI